MFKLILFAAAFVVLAAPAHADPVTAIAAWVVSATGWGMATAVAVTQYGIGLGVSLVSAAFQKRRMGRAGGANVTQTIEMGDDLPLSFTVGEYATAGKRKYVGSWGRNTRFITEVIEFSCLPQGLDGLWVNDERGEFVEGQRAWIGGVDPSDDSSWFEGASVPAGSIDIGQPLSNLSDDGNRIVVKVIDGTQTAADPFLLAVFGNDPDYPWTAEMVGRGKSYVIMTTRYDSESLTQYPTFLFEPSPLALYDWRLDSTAGGVGPQRWAAPSTWAPTSNPAVVSYNVARGIFYGDEWVFGGKNLAPWRLPIDEWTAAANACDQPIGLAGGGIEPRYRCGLQISADMEPASVLDELGAAANMGFSEVGGRLKPMVDLPGAAVFHFTDADILVSEGQSFSPFYPAAETFNSLFATYPERREKWASKDAPEYVDAEARAADKGQPRPAEATFGAVPFARQVQRLMRTLMRAYRRMRRHQFYLPPAAFALEPRIDLVSWTSERNGYINKQFTIERIGKTPGMNVLVNLRERDPSDYDWSSDFERGVVITTPVNSRPFVQPSTGFGAEPVTFLDQASQARRPGIMATYIGDEAGVTQIHIQGRVAGQLENTIDTLRRFAPPQRWPLRNVLPATPYEVRGRLFSDLTPRSIWSAWIPVTTPDVGFNWADWDQELRTSIEADLAAARQAALDVIEVDEKAQAVRDDHDALVEGFVGRLTDLAAADQGIQHRIDLVELSVNNTSLIRKTDGAAADGSAAIGSWTPLSGAALPNTGASTPTGETGRFLRVFAPGAYERPYYSGASMRDRTLRLRGWVYVDAGHTAHFALVGSVTGPGGETVLAQSDPITGGWQQIDLQLTVTGETREWAPAFLVSAGGGLRFWRVRLEDYSAPAALEASIGVTAQAVIDEGSARAAVVETLTARADSLAARILPSDMRNQAEFWTNSPGLAPEDTAGMAPGVVFGVDPNIGDYVRIPLAHAGNVHVLSRAVAEYAGPRRIRQTVRLRTPGGATGKLRVMVTALRADWTVSRFLATGLVIATTAGSTWQTVTLDYSIPERLIDEVWLRFGVFSNGTITPDRVIDVAFVRVDDITATDALVGEVSGEILDIKGLEVDALAGTAFGVLLEQLQVDAGGTSATITTQGSALATLEGAASAGYLIRARAGGAVSLIDLIAADGTSGPPLSVIKLSAQNIIADGTISAPQLVIFDPANLVPDNQFQTPAAWGLPAGPFVLVNAGSNFNSKGCIRFTKAGSGAGYSPWVQSQPFSVKRNADFHFEIRTTQLTGTVNSVWMRVIWYDSAGAPTTATVYAPGQLTGNHLAARTLRSPADAQTARVEVIVNLDLTNGDLNIGDFVVRAKEMGSTLITPDGITTDLVSADTMRALNGRFSDLMAANIRVGNAEIDTAHIADLSVSRIKIANESATTFPYAYTQAAQRVTTTSSWTTVQSLTFTKGRASPMPIYFRADVAAGSGEEYAGSIRLLRDGVMVRQYSLKTTASGEMVAGPNEWQFIDVDSAIGPVTFTMQANRSLSTASFIDLTHCFIGVLNAYK